MPNVSTQVLASVNKLRSLSRKSNVINILDCGIDFKADGSDEKAKLLAFFNALPTFRTVDLQGLSFSTGSNLAVNVQGTTIRNGSITALGGYSAIQVLAADCCFKEMSFSRPITTAGSTIDSLGSCVTINAARFRSIRSNYTGGYVSQLYLGSGTCNGTKIRGGKFSGSSVRKNAAGIYGAPSLLGNQDITIYDIEVDHGVGGSSEGVLLFDSQRCRVGRCRIQNCNKIPNYTLGPWTQVSGDIYSADDSIYGTSGVIFHNGVYIPGNVVSTTPAANNWSYDPPNNKVYVNLGSGVVPGTTGHLVTGGIVSGYGITIYSSHVNSVNDNTIHDNIVTDCDGFGIYMQMDFANSANNKTSNNKLRNVCKSGVQSANLPFAGIGWVGGINNQMLGDQVDGTGTTTTLTGWTQVSGDIYSISDPDYILGHPRIINHGITVTTQIYTTTPTTNQWSSISGTLYINVGSGIVPGATGHTITSLLPASGVKMVAGGESTTSYGRAVGVQVKNANKNGFEMAGDWGYQGCDSFNNTLSGFYAYYNGGSEYVRAILTGCNAIGNGTNGVTAQNLTGGTQVKVNINGGSFKSNVNSAVRFYGVTDCSISNALLESNSTTPGFNYIWASNGSNRITINNNNLTHTTTFGNAIRVEADCTNVMLGPNTCAGFNTSVLTLLAPVITSGVTGSITHWLGSGTPESVVTAIPGSTYRRTDGSAGTFLYQKDTGTGNTGWIAKS